MENYIKKKIRSLKLSATLAINEKSKKLLEDGRKVFRFGFGQSPFPVPKAEITPLGTGNGDCPKPNLKTFLPSSSNFFDFSLIANVADSLRDLIFFFI